MAVNYYNGKIVDTFMRSALAWLVDHDGVGRFIQNGEHVISFGIVAPFNRSTWIALRDAGLVEFREGKVRVL